MRIFSFVSGIFVVPMYILIGFVPGINSMSYRSISFAKMSLTSAAAKKRPGLRSPQYQTSAQ